MVRVGGHPLGEMYDSDTSDSSADGEPVDTGIVYNSGIRRVDDKLDDMRVGGDLGMYRFWEGSCGTHMYEIFHYYDPLTRTRAMDVIHKYMYDHEWFDFIQSLWYGGGTPMDDVLGLIYTFASFMDFKGEVDPVSVLAHLCMDTCKVVRDPYPRASHMLRRAR